MTTSFIPSSYTVQGNRLVFERAVQRNGEYFDVSIGLSNAQGGAVSLVGAHGARPELPQEIQVLVQGSIDALHTYLEAQTNPKQIKSLAQLGFVVEPGTKAKTTALVAAVGASALDALKNCGGDYSKLDPTIERLKTKEMKWSRDNLSKHWERPLEYSVHDAMVELRDRFSVETVTSIPSEAAAVKKNRSSGSPTSEEEDDFQSIRTDESGDEDSRSSVSDDGGLFENRGRQTPQSRSFGPAKELLETLAPGYQSPKSESPRLPSEFAANGASPTRKRSNARRSPSPSAGTPPLSPRVTKQKAQGDGISDRMAAKLRLQELKEKEIEELGRAFEAWKAGRAKKRWRLQSPWALEKLTIRELLALDENKEQGPTVRAIFEKAAANEHSKEGRLVRSLRDAIDGCATDFYQGYGNILTNPEVAIRDYVFNPLLSYWTSVN